MPKLNFYIEKRRTGEGKLKKKDLPIILYFSYEGKRFQFYTGQRTDLHYWDHTNQRLSYEAPYNQQKNEVLDQLEKEVWEIYHDAKAKGIKPGNEHLRISIRRARTREKADFFTVLLAYIDENSQHWSIHTFRKVKSFFNLMRGFSDRSGILIEFDRLDKSFFDRLADYCTHELEHSNTTLYKNLMVLKGFLNWATLKKYNRNKYYRNHRFPWKHEPKTGIMDLSLRYEELIRFYTHSYAEEKLGLARDLFCFICFTGINYSELKNLTGNDLKGEVLRVKSTRNPAGRLIPLNLFARRILDKYAEQHQPDSSLFPLFSQVTANRLLKVAAKQAGIDKQVEVVIHTGRMKRRKRVPRSELMCTKMAVNTFIMNAYQLGIPARTIMEFSGRTSGMSLAKYESDLARIKEQEMSKFDALPVANT